MITQAGDYGPLSNLVATAGMVIGAAAAIGFAFRGRAKWEPSEEDVSKGPQKVGGLAAAVVIVVIWSHYFEVSHLAQVTRIAWVLLGITIASLLIYILLVTMQTYYKTISPEASSTERIKIIGGFWLTPEAGRIKRKQRLTTQELLEGAAYDEDKVWSRSSRALAKISFVLCYLGLTACGTVALACAAIIVDLAGKR